MHCLAESAQRCDQMLAQLTLSPRRCRAQFLLASRHHHRKPIIVSGIHASTLTDADLKDKPTCPPDHIGARSSHLTGR
jgi:hypothetical protein